MNGRRSCHTWQPIRMPGMLCRAPAACEKFVSRGAAKARAADILSSPSTRRTISRYFARRLWQGRTSQLVAGATQCAEEDVDRAAPRLARAEKSQHRQASETNMKKSSKAGSRILQGAKEALDFARGDADLKKFRVHVPAEINVRTIRRRLR